MTPVFSFSGFGAAVGFVLGLVLWLGEAVGLGLGDAAGDGAVAGTDVGAAACSEPPESHPAASVTRAATVVAYVRARRMVTRETSQCGHRPVKGDLRTIVLD
ncbi:hypothetical protein Aau02nite_49790 [Amorphoplanes auranticolor]|uniref:Uncharacterized protein n=1 Tax=Actinoplanes auranticolor TaxID=47988 RepID=A0A919VQ67_9ACTN|nr:hypothetical protein Aau02nite_49790 [Actinoplanes auranticolor]